MGKLGAKSGRKKAVGGAKSIAPEVFKDNAAANQLSFKQKTYQGISKGNKTRNRAIDQGRVKRKKAARVYTEKELGIPKLNKALDPVGVAVKGKKGKKFVNDSKMAQIIAEVNEESSAVYASKLEKARQLEEIREAKRKEYEQKEQEKQERLDKKKKQVRKGDKGGRPGADLDDKAGAGKPKESKVRFA